MRSRRLAVLLAGAIAASSGIALGACTGPGGTAPTSSAPSTATAPSASSAPPAGVSEAAVRAVQRMSVAEQAGTVLMTAGTVSQFPSLAGLVARSGLGGVMLRGRSDASVEQVARAVASVQPGGMPVLVATDQEGGEVQVLQGPGFGSLPSAQEQARQSAAALTANAATWGRALRAAGVTLDLAPVADVPCPADRDDNPPIAELDRNYGWTVASVTRGVTSFVRGMAMARVATTAKHFPGLGCVTRNTDTSADVVDTTTTASSASVAAVRAGIRAGAGFVMVSSARYTRLDGGTSALFSNRIVTGLLRDRIGFRGVVMSDDVGGAKAVAAWSPGERARRFILAGGDLLLDIVPDDVPPMIQALRAAAANPVFAARLQLAAERVVTARLASR